MLQKVPGKAHGDNITLFKLHSFRPNKAELEELV